MQPKLSIIIPVYNTQDFLRECLDSALAQTMAEIEVICVNDGSTDGSEAILREYAERDPRVVVLTKQNGGQASARNVGMDVARGKYLAFLDSDDWIDKDLCTKAWSQAESAMADITMFFFDWVGFPDCENVPFSRIVPGDKVKMLDKLRTLGVNGQAVCCCVWNRAFLQQHGLRFHEGIRFEDSHFTCVAAALANKVTVLFDRLYSYRYRVGSTMHDSSGRNYVRQLQAFCQIREDLETIGAFDACKSLLWRQVFESLYANYYRPECLGVRADLLAEISRGFRPEDWRMAQEANFVASPAKRRFFRIIQEGGQPPDLDESAAEPRPLLDRLKKILPERVQSRVKALVLWLIDDSA